jgi:exopolysaccharide production protein ExoZ
MQRHTKQYDGIQALRFVAALLVVLVHATFYASERLVPGFPVWAPGAAGVDVFFVISGFVMVVSSAPLAGRPGAAAEFMARRVIRVVPLYWAATTIKLAAVLAVPAAVLAGGIDVAHVVASYLFLPWRDANGDLAPVLGVGWTLNFEMFFYAMFALALWARVPPIRFVGTLFVLLSIAALFRRPDWPAFSFWLDTIVLEFVAGMLIGQAALQGRRAPAAFGAALLVAGAVLLVWPWGKVPDMARVIFWGLPAIAIVAGTVLLEPVLAGRVPGWLTRLGDASYSLYLFHPLSAPIAPVVLAKLGIQNAWLSIAGSVAISIVVSLIVHALAERPVTAWLDRRRRARLAMRTA